MPLTLARSSESRQEFGNRALGWIFDRRRDSQSICCRNGEIVFAARFCGLAISESGPIALQRVAEFLCDRGCAIPFGSSTQRMRVDCCTIERSSRCKNLMGVRRKNSQMPPRQTKLSGTSKPRMLYGLRGPQKTFRAGKSVLLGFSTSYVLYTSCNLAETEGFEPSIGLYNPITV